MLRCKVCYDKMRINGGLEWYAAGEPLLPCMLAYVYTYTLSVFHKYTHGFVTLSHCQHQWVLLSCVNVHLSIWPYVCLSQRCYWPDSLRISYIGLKFVGVMHSIIKNENAVKSGYAQAKFLHSMELQFLQWETKTTWFTNDFTIQTLGFQISYWWLIARLLYLHCWCIGDTAVLH